MKTIENMIRRTKGWFLRSAEGDKSSFDYNALMHNLKASRDLTFLLELVGHSYLLHPSSNLRNT